MLWWFAQNAVIAAALVAVVWPVCRIRRVGPAVRHALWLVVLLKLMTPPLVSWPWSAPRVFEWLLPDGMGGDFGSIAGETTERGNAASEMAPDSNSDVLSFAEWFKEADSPTVQCPFDDSGTVEFSVAAFGEEPAMLDSPDKMDSGAVAPAFRSESPEKTTASYVLSLVTGRIIYLVGACWLLGTAASILVHAIQVIRFTRLVARVEPSSPSLLRRVTRVAAMLRVRPPRVVVVAGIRSPVIWGGVRTQLVWPACLIEARRVSEGSGSVCEASVPDSPRSRVGLPSDFDSGRWDGVIAHELAHLRRRDHWIGWLELLAGCVWWWNPLFWYVRHQLRENAELACDALVVWALPDGRRRYAESLIEVVSHFSPVATPVPVLGVNSVARQAFERRLTMILCERVPWKLSARGLLAIGVLTLVALPGWTIGQDVPAPKLPELPLADTSTSPVVVSVEDPPALPQPALVPLTEPAGQATFALEAFFAADPSIGQASGDDSRMDALEKKLEAIIAEVKAMRANRNATVKYSVAAQGTPQVPAAADRLVRAAALGEATKPAQARLRLDLKAAGTDSDVQMLSRGTYPLPKAKAEALAAFLREHMKLVETSVKDDDGKTSLIVTTSPEALAVIGQFIGLSEGKQPTAAANLFKVSSPQQNILYRPVDAAPKYSPPPTKAQPAKPVEPPAASPPANRQ